MQRRNLFCLVSVLAVVVVVVVAFALSTGWEPSPAFSQGGTPTPPGGTTFTVNTHGDGGNPTPDGTCDDGAGNCTLREAILEANYVAGADTINFSIGTGYGWVVLTSALPTITDPVTIDGGTQEAGDLGWVELNGDGTSGADGLHITAGHSTVRRLLIVDFDGDGIVLEGGGENVIRSNFIGLDHHTPRGNGGHGVRITDSAKNAVGVPLGGGNFISGNGGDGVHISGSGADGNLIQSNTIGLQLNGDPLGNGSHGVSISGNNNVVGGAATPCSPPYPPCVQETPATVNYIAFNGGAGVYVASGAGNTIRANNIYDNVGLGIDVAPIGPSNPYGGRLTSALQAPALFDGEFRRIIAATGYISGGPPNTPVVVEAFIGPTPDPLGYGEGKTYRAGTDPAAFSFDDKGVLSAAGFFPVSTSGTYVGQFLTTTRTYPDGHTDEFSNWVEIKWDSDGDNIQDEIDTVPGTSHDFDDRPLGGTTSGSLIEVGPGGRNGCWVSVVDLPQPDGVVIGSTCAPKPGGGFEGPAHVSMCGGKFTFDLPHATSMDWTCHSAEVSVGYGPVFVQLGTITAKLPTAAKVEISDPVGGDYEIVNDSTSPAILVGGLSVAPGETVTVQDTDGDGMVNAYETAHTCLDPDVDDAAEDPDSDDLSNLSEAELETDPCDSDTDNDGMPDGYEAGKTCLDPLANDATSDPDRDWRSNVAEYGLGSDPCVFSGYAPVGGIAELPDLAPGAAQPSDAPPEGSGWSGGTYAALAAGVAASVLALAGAGWYARRRWLKA